MTEWKEAFWLVKFELKHSLKQFPLLALGFVLIFLLITSISPNYFEQATMGLDFFFAIIFSGFLSQLARPKDFQLQKFRSIRYAAPFLTALNQLAMKREVIVKYRFITYFVLLLLSNGLLLILLYPTFQAFMTLPAYIAFAFIWFCFGIYIGCVTPAFEVGSNLGWNIFYGCFIGFGLILLYLFVFYKWYKNGLITWTIDIANYYPVISIVVSIILSIIGWNFWMKIMRNRMKKTDYL